MFCRFVNYEIIFNYVFLCFSLLMFFAQKNEKEAAQEDRKDFVELQNALQCIIASFVECPQVHKSLGGGLASEKSS